MSKNISYSKRDGAWNKTGGKCWYCGIPLVKASFDDVKNQRSDDVNSSIWFTIDHVVPRSSGGSNGIENLIPACLKCNISKGKKTIDKYRYYVSRMRVGAPAFTNEQIEYLDMHGIEIPVIELIKFWGEL